MKIEIFFGPRGEVCNEVRDWIDNKNRARNGNLVIHSIAQSQSIDLQGDIELTITVVYE